MLSGHGYEVEYLLGPKATRQAILQKLDALSGKGNSSGICVVGFFGHGVEVEFQGAEGKKDIQGCFCPFETAVRQVSDEDGNKQFDVNGKPKVEPVPETLVKMSEVVNSLTLAKAGARMLLADCCRDMPNRARGRNLGLGANFSTDRLPGQTVMLFGCRPGERALERDDWKHGAFTKSLLEELTSMAAGPDPVTSGTLADRVKRRVRRLTSNEQNPTPISLDSIDLLLEKSLGQLPIIDIDRGGGETIALLDLMHEKTKVNAAKTTSVRTNANPSLKKGFGETSVTTLPSGVAFSDLVEGDPSRVASPKSTVTVEYKSYFASTMEQISPERLGATRFTLQVDDIRPAGVQDGLIGVGVGGTRRVFVPANLAFGSEGSKDVRGQRLVPPNTDVVWDFEVVFIKNPKPD
jgi:FKBP-type peptidyl-prolyl cis-trans isomerase